MGKDIWFWNYELISATGLNSVSRKTRHPGALIRVGGGFGCIHPWPELGDLPIDQQLKCLAEGQPTSLASISVTCAELDGAARSKGINLFDEVDASIPLSHWLYQADDDVSAIREKGFTTAKLKIGPSVPASDIIRSMADAGLKIRIDANGSYQVESFLNWWKSLPKKIQEQIEFVEDPVPWNTNHWELLKNAGVPLAIDREIQQRPAICSWAILKPAVDSNAALLPWIKEHDLKVAVTSYMDHPLGQMWAAYRAQLWNADEPDRLGDCGLLTHRCFEENKFSEQIQTDGAELKATEGTGLGFDELLESLPWKRLT